MGTICDSFNCISGVRFRFGCSGGSGGFVSVVPVVPVVSFRRFRFGVSVFRVLVHALDECSIKLAEMESMFSSRKNCKEFLSFSGYVKIRETT